MLTSGNLVRYYVPYRMFEIKRFGMFPMNDTLIPVNYILDEIMSDIQEHKLAHC